MKRLFFTVLIIAVVSAIAEAKYSGGSGTDSGVLGGRICADQSR